MTQYCNAFREAIDSGRFVVTLEYTAPDRSESIDDLIALATYVRDEPRIQTIGITDRVVGEDSHDSIALAVRAGEVSGKMPLVHLSGKNHDKLAMQRRVQQLLDLGLINPLIVTGDVPRTGQTFTSNVEVDQVAPGGFLDSVQAIDLTRQMSAAFTISGATTSFKYTEPSQMMQYLKLRKKASHGLDVVFNQVGYDLRKTQELTQYMRLNELKLPAIAALYWLTPGFAKFANRGEVPGVVMTEDLVDLLGAWSKLPDKGKANRVEMMAMHIVLARLFGYAGVHVGGFKKADTLKEVLDRVDAIWATEPEIDTVWSMWCELTRFEDGRQVSFCPVENGFYLFQGDSRGLNGPELAPDTLEVSQPAKFRILRGLHDMLFTDFMEDGHLGHGLGKLLHRHPVLHRMTYLCERMAKAPLVGCEGCGSCSLPEAQYVCIEATCGKGLANGPCGGSREDGMCEAIPGRECAWAEIYRRAKASGTLDELAQAYVPPKDGRLRGTCSWMNLALGLDHHGQKDGSADPEPTDGTS